MRWSGGKKKKRFACQWINNNVPLRMIYLSCLKQRQKPLRFWIQLDLCKPMTVCGNFNSRHVQWIHLLQGEIQTRFCLSLCDWKPKGILKRVNLMRFLRWIGGRESTLLNFLAKTNQTSMMLCCMRQILIKQRKKAKHKGKEGIRRALLSKHQTTN